MSGPRVNDEVFRRVAERSGYDAEIVRDVALRAIEEITKIMVKGEAARFDGFGMFWARRRVQTFRKVVVVGGARQTVVIRASVVPVFRPNKKTQG